MAADKRLLRAIERERRIRGEDVFGQPTITLLHPKYAKGRSPDDALDDLEAAHAEEFQPTGVPSAPGESPEGTTPTARGRTPTFRERLFIKHYGGLRPEAVSKFMKDRGIDPTFDEGTDLHDFTTDILGDVAGVGGGIVGGLAGVPGGVPGIVAGSAAGGALGQAFSDALGAAADPRTEQEIAQQSPVTLGERAGRLARAGALEGLGGAAFGVGRVPGLASRAFKRGTGQALRSVLSRVEGIGTDVLDYMGKNTDKLREIARRSPYSAKGAKDLSHTFRDDILASWDKVDHTVKEGAKDLKKAINKKKMTAPQLGITRDVVDTFKSHPDTRYLGNKIDKFLANQSQDLTKLERLKVLNPDLSPSLLKDVSKDVPYPNVGPNLLKEVTPLTGETVLDINKALGKLRSKGAGPVGLAEDVQSGITDAIIQNNPGTAHLWNKFDRATRLRKDLKRLNKGENIRIKKKSAGKKTVYEDNLNPEFTQRYYKDLTNPNLERTDATSRAVGDAIPSFTPREYLKGRSLQARAVDALYPDQARRIGDVHPSAYNVIRQAARAVSHPFLRHSQRLLHGPDTAVPQGLDVLLDPKSQSLIKRGLKKALSGGYSATGVVPEQAVKSGDILLEALNNPS